MNLSIPAAVTLIAIAQFGGGVNSRPPVSTIPSLSIAASDDSPAMVLCVYRLLPPSDKSPRPTADELAPIVRELFAPESWDAHGAYLRAVNDCLLVRQSPEVQREILALLIELRAIESPTRKRRGHPWLESVVPVVGERGSSGRW